MHFTYHERDSNSIIVFKESNALQFLEREVIVIMLKIIIISVIIFTPTYNIYSPFSQGQSVSLNLIKQYKLSRYRHAHAKGRGV
jgi:hypothetical protein